MALGRLWCHPAEEERLTSPYVVVLCAFGFTGARLNEILTLRWDHVDLERGWLNRADSKTGAKTVYLNVPARRLLGDLPGWKAIRSWCRSSAGAKHLVNWKALAQIRELAQLPDLRCTTSALVASIGAGAGLGLPVIVPCLGHAQALRRLAMPTCIRPVQQAAADLIGGKLAAAMNVDKRRSPDESRRTRQSA